MRALVVVDTSRTSRGVPSGTLAIQAVAHPGGARRRLGARARARRRGVSVEVEASAPRQESENVIAETPGGTGDRVVMAGGHLDSVPGGPGINDNGSGTAALIEAAEAIGRQPPGARVRLAFWGAEEVGLAGSRHYVRLAAPGRAPPHRARTSTSTWSARPNAVPELYVDGDPA